MAVQPGFKDKLECINQIERSVMIKTRKSNIILGVCLLFVISGNAQIPIDSLLGFADATGDGLETTTGGLGGDTIIVTSGDQLNQIMLDRKDSNFDDNNPPINLLISGTIHYPAEEMLRVKETYDLSIIGMGDSAVIEGFGLNVYKTHNLIIRNIEFRDCPDDAINIDQTLTHHVWVDHCTFSDMPDIYPSGDHDGLLDIKHGASYVTVSWNHFYNHGKTCLLGHSDSNSGEDLDRLKVTYHHNWFDNTHSRHPRARFGEVHVVNNYYENSENTMLYGIASTMEADVVVEANYFENVQAPTHVGYGSSADGDVVELNNVYANSGNPEVRGDAFSPSAYYTYEADVAEDIPDRVVSHAGAGVLDLMNPSAIGGEPLSLPQRASIHQNYPNPFNQGTMIPFSVHRSSRVTIQIFDVEGRLVNTLVNEWVNRGEHQLQWDGFDAESRALPTGLYLGKLTSGYTTSSIKLLLLK